MVGYAGMTAPTAAAEPTVTARVSATELNLSGSIILTIEVSGVTNVNAPPRLDLPDFQAQGAGQTQSYQWINGESSSLTAFNYSLTPLRAGALQIPPISFTYEGKSYTTQPLAVTVHAEAGAPATQAPSGGSAPSGSVPVPTEGLKPVFMTASVDNSNVYVGQQIILRVQFLRRPDVRLASQPRYAEPDMTGFLVEPLKQQEFTTTINGAGYEVTELRYALFPTSDGDYAIGSSNVELGVRTQPDPFDPNSFFESFFGRSQLLRVNTRAIPIHVRALPKVKPANFSGAVGRYKLTSRTDTPEPEVGKPFNLIVTVEGVGNVKAVKEPALPPLNSFRRYETISSSKVNKDGKFLYGSKEFKILLIPQISGPVTLPSLSLPYFNPEERDYVTATAPPIPLNIKAGTMAQGDQESIQETPVGAMAEGIRVVEKDIRFVKTGKLKIAGPPIYLRGPFLLFSMIPPIFALGAAITRRREAHRVMNPTEYRSRRALKAALRNLKKAKKLIASPDPNLFYSALYAALSGFLADKLGLSASGLLWEDLDRRLAERNVPSDTRGAVREIFDVSDLARFATSSLPLEVRERSLAGVDRILRQLNKIL